MFEWDEGNVDHIARHGVLPEEAEEAASDPARVYRAVHAVPGERRWAVIGMTEAGRIVFVVYTRRSRRVRVVSVRDAGENEKLHYRRVSR